MGRLGAWNQAGFIEPDRLGPERAQRVPRLLLCFDLTTEGFYPHPTPGLCLLFFKNCDSTFSFINFMLNNTFLKAPKLGAREKQFTLCGQLSRPLRGDYVAPNPMTVPWGFPGAAEPGSGGGEIRGCKAEREQKVGHRGKSGRGEDIT